MSALRPVTARAAALVALAAAGSLLLGACAAPTDADGEPVPAGPLAVAPALAPDAAPVVVDTDLGADDLVALAYLLRHPDVDVRAVTLALTGLAQHCAAGVDVVADLLTALDEPPVPVACGRDDAGPRAEPFPAAWRMGALTGSGLPRDRGSLPTDPRPAAELIGDLADAGATGTGDDAAAGMAVVALGPLTNLADLAAQRPASWARLASVHAMGGVVDGPGQEDGLGEWNAGADPDALDAVLAAAAVGGVPLTLVPADAVPAGTPDALHAPVVGHVVLRAEADTWWDVAAAAAFTEGADVRCGSWAQAPEEAGRLMPGDDGDGPVCVVGRLDEARLEAAYAVAFTWAAAEPRAEAAPRAASG